MAVQKQAATLDELISLLGLEGEVLGDSWTGKRSNPRFALVIPVSVRHLEASGPGAETVCRLWDISRTGMCVTSYFRFEVGHTLEVELEVDDTRWSGQMRVMHCTQTISGYKVGLKLAELAEADLAAEARAPSVPAARPWRTHADSTATARPTGTADRAKTHIRRAYHTWGLMDIPVHGLFTEATEEAAQEPDGDDAASHRRQHPRFPVDVETHLILASSFGWRPIAAHVEDIGEGGLRLLVRHDVVEGHAEREQADDWTIAVGMPIMARFGREPHILWVPAEVIRCEPAAENRVRLAIQFETPRAMAFAGRVAR